MPPPEYIYFGTYAGIYGTPALGTDGTVYVASENGKLLALNPTNGVVKWTYSIVSADGLYASPAVGVDGTIYFGVYDANFYAINPNGSRKWVYRAGATIFASPAIGLDGTIFFGADDGKLYALKDNGATGTARWIFTTGTNAITAAPAIGSDGSIYIGVGSIFNPKLYSVSTNGTTNWIFTTGSRVRSSPAIGADGTIYFGCDDKRLYALNPNGTKKWDFLAGGAVGSSPAVTADGTVLFGCDDGKLYALDANGKLLWTFATGDYIFASPAIGPDGTIYIASADGALYVLRGCRPPANTPWPMYRYNVARTGRAVTSANQLPALAPIADRMIGAGATLSFTNVASDPDQPGQQLTFSLAVSAPTGATINPTTGGFSWTPTEAQAGSTNVIGVAVADNGTPALSDARCFTVVVSSVFRIASIVASNGTVTMTWPAIPGKSYRVQYKPLLDAATMWTDLPGTVTATSDLAVKTDTPGNVRQRFYRVAALP
jgi:outer membrane protein assembly factor BamB